MGSHQFHRLHDRIDRVLVFPRNPILCFDAVESHSSLDVKGETRESPHLRPEIYTSHAFK